MHVVFVELCIVVLSSVVTISNCSFNRDADDRSEQIQSEIGSEQIGVRGSTQRLSICGPPLVRRSLSFVLNALPDLQECSLSNI